MTIKEFEKEGVGGKGMVVGVRMSEGKGEVQLVFNKILEILVRSCKSPRPSLPPHWMLREVFKNGNGLYEEGHWDWHEDSNKDI